jgi:hypothetical protein
VSGSAKTTGVLRDLAEIVTACHNAIALDLDPVKDGLREFEGVMAVPADPRQQGLRGVARDLVKMAKGRNTVRNRLNMGDTWVATREHPAIFPFVDEFIYLSQTRQGALHRTAAPGQAVRDLPGRRRPGRHQRRHG